MRSARPLEALPALPRLPRRNIALEQDHAASRQRVTSSFR
jgi:hypothetical protein